MTNEVTLAQCPIGLFWAGDELCLKTEYGNNEGRIDAYIVSTGEFFWGSHPQTIPNQRMQMVRPVPEEALARLTAKSGEQQSCEPIATVEMIETVTGDFYTEPGEPIWRVMVGEYCADFDSEQAARNFASAINLAAQSGEGRSGAGEDVGPFHVSQSGDGKKLWFSARDPASGVTIPARDRTDARNLVSSLNHACATFAALNARQSGEGERLREVLVEHFPTGLRGLYEQSAQRIPVLTYVGTNCLCGWCTSATDEHEVREEWAAHVLAALRATDYAGGRP